MVTAIAGEGTPETVWQSWPAPHAWPTLALDPDRPPIVVAPHPDDEILGVAGLLATLGSGGQSAIAAHARQSSSGVPFPSIALTTASPPR